MRNSLNLSRLPSLDGWRALSIIMVLGGHTGTIVSRQARPFFDFLFDGNLGVRFFFGISGFLITWLLLQELNQSGKIQLKLFYLRRGLRILPVYLMFILVLCGLQIFTPFRETTAGWLGMLTFTRNFVEGSGASAHFWSLSVEEQFYLVWPSLLILMNRCRLRAKMTLLAVPILVAPIFRAGTYVFYFQHDHIFRGTAGIHLKPAFLEALFYKYSFFCYFDTLAFGCLCALLLNDESPRMAKIFEKWRVAAPVTGSLLVVLPHVLSSFVVSGWLRVGLIIFGTSIQALGFSLLLCHSVLAPHWPGFRALNWKWVCWIGVLSYSIYIWQQLFCNLPWKGTKLEPHDTDPYWAWFWLIPTLGVAVFSYYALERPFFRLRSRLRQP